MSFRRLSRLVTVIAAALVFIPPWLLVLSWHFGWTTHEDTWPIVQREFTGGGNAFERRPLTVMAGQLCGDFLLLADETVCGHHAGTTNSAQRDTNSSSEQS
jgi:hypothetical protein